MKSKKAKEYVDVKYKEFTKIGIPFANDMTKVICNAVETAEDEICEKVIEALYEVCRYNKKGDCNSFIVGYDTPDDRLHEKCKLAREYDVCKEKTRIKRFIELIDNDKKE